VRKGDEVRCVWEAGCELGEGPVWDARTETLYFVDIKGDAVLAYNDRTGGSSSLFPGSPSAIVPLIDEEALLCASVRGLERFWPENGRREQVGSIDLEPPGNRTNDGKCDPAGRFWVGTMDDAEQSYSGTLYCFDAVASARAVITNIGVSNGLDWSPDGASFYYTDSLRRTIWHFPFDVATGELGLRRVFALVPKETGAPDGLAVDAEGFVWSAHWDGWRVTRYAPDGRIDRIIRLPVPRPTSVSFGGNGFETLFITSARIGLATETLDQAASSGALFACEPGVRGRPPSLARI